MGLPRARVASAGASPPEGVSRTGISLKWRIAALTAVLLVAFAALVSGAVLTVLNGSLLSYQQSVLEKDADRVKDLFARLDPARVDLGTFGGVTIGLYRPDGTLFDGRGVPVPRPLIARALRERVFWSGNSLGEPVSAVLQPVDLRFGRLQPVRYVLAVNASTRFVRDVSVAVGKAVVAVTAVLVVLALAGGYWAASFGLRPLVRVARQATQLDETNLRPLEYGGPRDELGRLTATLNALVDRLKRAFDAQRVFLAETSHELRTPLTALEGYLHRALREATPESRPALDDALRVSRTMTRLVADLLQLSRGEVVNEWVPHLVDLSGIARGVAREFDGVSCDCPSGRAEMIGDPDRLTQVARNLVANAVRAAGGPGGVSVSVRSAGDRVELHVRDRGPGIPAEVLPNIFAKFYRGPRGGSGLGLAIVAQIVRVHRGDIQVESEPGNGAHFWASFPAYREADDAVD